MRVRNGDIVFGSSGRPGVVMDRNTINGKLTVEDHGPSYEHARHVGFINGLSTTERAAFEEVMGRVHKHSDPSSRLAEIMAAIEELDRDPRNIHLTRYLQSEQAHLMYTEGLYPRQYKLDETKL